MLGHAELPAVDVGVPRHRAARRVEPLGRLRRDRLEFAGPDFALDRQALRDRRALAQHAVEGGIVPARRKVQQAVAEGVAVDQPGDGGERQIGAVDRMREQQRIRSEERRVGKECRL